MIPLSDLNPAKRRPWVTMALIAICTVVFFAVQPVGRDVFFDNDPFVDNDDIEFSFEHAAIPCELFQNRPLAESELPLFGVSGSENSCTDGLDPSEAKLFPDKNVWLAVLVSMFLHGNLAHLIGNMLFLWVFGNNIEDRRGRFAYAVFYVIAGFVATIAHAVINPDSTIPLVGASGAIAGVMGAYLVWFPNVRIRTLIVLPPLFRKVTAKWVLGFWFVSGLLYDWVLVEVLLDESSGVAWMAHVGGFIFGCIFGLIWRKQVPVGRPEAPGPEPATAWIR